MVDIEEILNLEKVGVGETYKGIVKDIGVATIVETKWGKTYRIPLTIELMDKSIVNVSIFVREKTVQLKKVNPRSNLYKILETYNCKTLKDLKGKQVNVRVDAKGFFRLVY
jgi:hypothetical protein